MKISNYTIDLRGDINEHVSSVQLMIASNPAKGEDYMCFIPTSSVYNAKDQSIVCSMIPDYIYAIRTDYFDGHCFYKYITIENSQLKELKLKDFWNN